MLEFYKEMDAVGIEEYYRALGRKLKVARPFLSDDYVVIDQDMDSSTRLDFVVPRKWRLDKNRQPIDPLIRLHEKFMPINEPILPRKITDALRYCFNSYSVAFGKFEPSMFVVNGFVGKFEPSMFIVSDFACADHLLLTCFSPRKTTPYMMKCDFFGGANEHPAVIHSIVYNVGAPKDSPDLGAYGMMVVDMARMAEPELVAAAYYDYMATLLIQFAETNRQLSDAMDEEREWFELFQFTFDNLFGDDAAEKNRIELDANTGAVIWDRSDGDSFSYPCSANGLKKFFDNARLYAAIAD